MKPSFTELGLLALAAAPLGVIPLAIPFGAAQAKAEPRVALHTQVQGERPEPLHRKAARPQTN